MKKVLEVVFMVIITILFLSEVEGFGYSGGTGEPNTPYEINDVNDLLELSADVNNYDKCFIMTDDIDLAGYDFNNAVISPWPVVESIYFTGKFNGSGYKIKNLTISGDNRNLGLFGFIDSEGEVSNLSLEDVNITATGGDAACCRGSYGGLASSNSGTIINCCSVGTIVRKHTNCDAGGLVGGNNGIIICCQSGGFVISDIVYNDAGPENYGIGGLVGLNYNGSISDSYSTTNVSNDVSTLSWEGTGGLVGHYGNISRCFATGSVYGRDNVGGLVGTYGNIENCYSTGDVNGRWNVGGLVGNDGYIQNSYSTGVVSGVSYVGGLSGGSSMDVNSYFLETSGPDNGYGTPLPDANMKQQASFVGWDFTGESLNGTEDIWWINEGYDYPKFAWQVFKDANGYSQWVSVGSPQCWLGKYGNPSWKFQCYGDADNETQTVSKYRVYNSDYTYLVASWKMTATQLINNPDPNVTSCADFDHKAESAFKYRIYTSDYNILMANWKKTDTQLQPWCPIEQ